MNIRIAINSKTVDGPFGGANQFAKNIAVGLKAAGYYVTSALEPDLDVIIIVISHDGLRLVSFSPADVEAYKIAYPNTIVIQRVNGSDEHRGVDNGTNRRIIEANKISDHTVFVSDFMRRFWSERGINRPDKTSVILTAANRKIFHSVGRSKWSAEGPIKIVTHHWSSNYMKGFDIYQRLDEMLVLQEWKDRIEFTFIGNMPLGYELINANCIPPMEGEKMADELRQHHLYVSASRYEAGGNHYIEAMQCGLPVLHLNHGSLPEYCAEYGITFSLTNFSEKLEDIIQNYGRLFEKVLKCQLDEKIMVNEYVDLIEDLISNHKKSKISNHPFKFKLYELKKKITHFRKRLGNRIAR